jgi:hypothetical protein
LFSLLTACDKLDNCPDAGDPREIFPSKSGEAGAAASDEGEGGSGGADGTSDVSTGPLFYESAPWGGPLTPFPPDTDLHFIHNLGHVPTMVKTYLAFSSAGTSEGDVTENAGNQGRIQCVDAERIVIENDTCEEDFFIRVVAISSGKESDKISCKPNVAE